MNRRNFLKAAAAGVTASALDLTATPATPGLPSPKIRDISVIATAPEGLRLTVVKITTDQDGLYGYGCGTLPSAPNW